MRFLLTDAEIAMLASLRVQLTVQPFNWRMRCWQPMRPTPSPIAEFSGPVGFWGLNVALGPVALCITINPMHQAAPLVIERT